jgi:hypothetical protein
MMTTPISRPADPSPARTSGRPCACTVVSAGPSNCGPRNSSLPVNRFPAQTQGLNTVSYDFLTSADPVDSGETAGICLRATTSHGPAQMGACAPVRPSRRRRRTAARGKAPSAAGVTAGRRPGHAAQAVTGGTPSASRGSRLRGVRAAGPHPRVLKGPTCPSIPPQPDRQRQGPKSGIATTCGR